MIARTNEGKIDFKKVNEMSGRALFYGFCSSSNNLQK